MQEEPIFTSYMCNQSRINFRSVYRPLNIHVHVIASISWKMDRFNFVTLLFLMFLFLFSMKSMNCKLLNWNGFLYLNSLIVIFIILRRNGKKVMFIKDLSYMTFTGLITYKRSFKFNSIEFYTINQSSSIKNFKFSTNWTRLSRGIELLARCGLGTCSMKYVFAPTRRPVPVAVNVRGVIFQF